MSVAALKAQTHQAVASGLGADVLSRIHDPDTQLAIWRRPATRLLTWIDGLDFEVIDDVQTTVQLPCPLDELSQMLVQAGYPADPLRDALAQEIVRYATIFARIMG